MRNQPIYYDPTETYHVVATALHRRRKPPKMQPRWVADLNPRRSQRVRSGNGASLAAMLTDEGLTKVLASAQKMAEPEHLLYVTLELDHEGGPVLASWNRWRNTWSVTPLRDKTAAPKPATTTRRDIIVGQYLVIAESNGTGNVYEGEGSGEHVHHAPTFEEARSWAYEQMGMTPPAEDP